MDDELPHLVRAHVAAHPPCDLEAVRPALGKVADGVRKEPPLPVSLPDEFVAPVPGDDAEASFH